MSADAAACVDRLNAESLRLGGDQRFAASLESNRLVYRIGKVRDCFLATHTYELLLALAKMPVGRATTIDLGDCRVVSSLELTLIGYVISQTRFHGGVVQVRNAGRVVANALRMVGFETLLAQDQPAGGPNQQTQLRP